MSVCMECRYGFFQAPASDDGSGFDGIEFGQCRKSPPAINRDDDEVEGIWPVVDAMSWCGEFKGRDMTQHHWNYAPREGKHATA